MSSVNQDMSLFIPRVFLNITGDRIKMAIQEFGLGQVERVDLVNKGTYNAAYVHFKVWANTSFVAGFQERAADPEQKCILEYDNPWYWIVLENTSAKRVGPERRKEVINLRPDFMEPFPLSPRVNESNVPYSVLEDLMWDMEEMQVTINELRATLEASGYQFVDDEPEPELDDSATAADEMKRELRSMKQEIEQLREAISGRERVITCAMSGIQFKEITHLRYSYEAVKEEQPRPGGITRDVADNFVKSDDLWEYWLPVEVESNEIPGLYNQMFRNKYSGEIADLGNLMELGMSKKCQIQEQMEEVAF